MGVHVGGGDWRFKRKSGLLVSWITPQFLGYNHRWMLLLFSWMRSSHGRANTKVSSGYKYAGIDECR